jgi:hypothetical protein
MDNITVIGIDEYDAKIAGPNCNWRYDPDTLTLSVSGNGTFVGVAREEQIGCGPYTTIIFGANVNSIIGNVRFSDSVNTLVFLHSEDFPLIIGSDITENKTAYEVVIYADNLAVRNYEWPSNVNITWYNLDEWEG